MKLSIQYLGAVAALMTIGTSFGAYVGWLGEFPALLVSTIAVLAWVHALLKAKYTREGEPDSSWKAARRGFLSAGCAMAVALAVTYFAVETPRIGDDDSLTAGPVHETLTAKLEPVDGSVVDRDVTTFVQLATPVPPGHKVWVAHQEVGVNGDGVADYGRYYLASSECDISGGDDLRFECPSMPLGEDEASASGKKFQIIAVVASPALHQAYELELSIDSEWYANPVDKDGDPLPEGNIIHDLMPLGDDSWIVGRVIVERR